jgi:uncharacterized protein (DUF1800 family)
MADAEAWLAVARFGLGARPGELRKVGRDARGWLRGQLVARVPRPGELADLPDVATIVAEAAVARADGEDAKKKLQKEHRQLYLREAGAVARLRVKTSEPFRERLVAFWSNHFAISVGKNPVAGLAGAYEREAIRPHVCGRFEDMLLASARHPGMLLYLDQNRSVGPGSRVGARKGDGLNENLAREILELHTLGVDGGYEQKDVEALARILTGFTVAPPDKGGRDGFLFLDNRHEPGAKTLLGVRYAEDGEQEGIQALTDLARHPSTAKHVAKKLARHFAGDSPPDALVKRLEDTFVDSGGHLGQLAGVLVEDDACWSPLPVKLKSPQDLVISTARALDYDGEDAPLVTSMDNLGQAPWRVPSPAGWPDTEEGWTGPEAVLRRVEWAGLVGEKHGARAEPAELAEEVLGPWLDDDLASMLRESDPALALALLVASPAFQRR